MGQINLKNVRKIYIPTAVDGGRNIKISPDVVLGLIGYMLQHIIDYSN